MTPAAAIRLIRKDIGSAAVRAVNRTLTELKAEAVKMSSGPFKTAQLRKNKWHPYAKRHGTPLLDPALINVQDPVSGFRSNWATSRARLTDPGSSGVLASGRLFNDDEIADILDEGTPTMFRRPIRDHLEVEAVRLLNRNLEREIRRTESKHGR